MINGVDDGFGSSAWQRRMVHNRFPLDIELGMAILRGVDFNAGRP